ncbi:MAG: PEP-CTERM sorting domain-containing protein [Anaerohalosphaeraceae bacterium]
MKTNVFLSLALCAVLAITMPASASVLAVWNFGDSSAFYTESPAYYNTVSAPALSLLGSGLDTNGKNGIAYTDAAGISHIAGQGAAWDDINKSGSDNDAALTITLNTTGFSDLTIRWNYKSELATSFDFAYRTSANGNWMQVADNQAITPGWASDSWYSVTLDLSALIALDNQSYVQFRLDDLVEGPGNDKFAIDNIEITSIPEPASLLILGLGGMALRMRKK